MVTPHLTRGGQVSRVGRSAVVAGACVRKCLPCVCSCVRACERERACVRALGRVCWRGGSKLKEWVRWYICTDSPAPLLLCGAA